MSSENGFGGDGSSERTEVGPEGDKLRCVNDGPFSKLRPEWLGVTTEKKVGGGHCLFRKLPEVSEPEAFAINIGIFGPENIANVLARDTWDMFHWDLEGGPHGIIHASLGGEMNPTTSPNGP
jgi:tyrosinase